MYPPRLPVSPMARSFLLGAPNGSTPALGDCSHPRSHLPIYRRRDQSTNREGISTGNRPSPGLALTRGYARTLHASPGLGLTHYPVTLYGWPSCAYREEEEEIVGGEASNADAEAKKEVKEVCKAKRVRTSVPRRMHTLGPQERGKGQ